MQDRFYWPHMVEDVRVHIQNCMRCIKFKQKESRDEMVCIEATYPVATGTLRLLADWKQEER